MKTYFSNEDIIKMKKNAKNICISIYMQTPRSGVDSQLYFIELKNKLAGVRKKLDRFGIVVEEIENFISLSKQYFKDNNIEGKLDKSIALFYSDRKFYGYILPMMVEEKVEISDSFYTSPLERFLDSNGEKYYILMLDQNNVRLFKATAYEMEEIELNGFPRSIGEYFSNEEYNNRTLQSHSNNSKIIKGNRANFYSVGDSKANDKKNEIQRYFASVNDVVTKVLHGKVEPLILVGTEYLFPIYKSVNTYSHILEKGVKGNPDTLKIGKIREETLKIVNS